MHHNMEHLFPVKTMLVVFLLGYVGTSAGILSSSSEDPSYTTRYTTLEKLHGASTSTASSHEELLDLADNLDALKNLFSLPSLLRRKYQVQNLQNDMLQYNASEACVNNTMQILGGLLGQERWALKCEYCNKWSKS
jgi:hypothetical protein